MKSYKITYWITTGFISLIMLFTSYAYLSKAPQVMAELQKAGMPYYIFVFLGIIKILGVIGLLFVKRPVAKEWIYAGFVYLLVGAVWLHIATSTSPVMAIFSLIVLIVSYLCSRRLNMPGT